MSRAAHATERNETPRDASGAAIADEALALMRRSRTAGSPATAPAGAGWRP